MPDDCCRGHVAAAVDSHVEKVAAFGAKKTEAFLVAAKSKEPLIWEVHHRSIAETTDILVA